MITPTMHYSKIAGGRLDHEMQLAFLEAQTMGEHHGVGTTVTLEIKIVPKLPNEEFGAIQYSIGVKRQGKKSKGFSTQINAEGYIAFDSGANLAQSGSMPVPGPRQAQMFEEDDSPAPTKDPNHISFNRGES